MKRLLHLNVQPATEDQFIIALHQYRVRDGVAEFEFNHVDIPVIIEQFQKFYDDVEKDKKTREVKV